MIRHFAPCHHDRQHLRRARQGGTAEATTPVTALWQRNPDARVPSDFAGNGPADLAH
jgi:hypothetical protein